MSRDSPDRLDLSRRYFCARGGSRRIGRNEMPTTDGSVAQNTLDPDLGVISGRLFPPMTNADVFTTDCSMIFATRNLIGRDFPRVCGERRRGAQKCPPVGQHFNPRHARRGPRVANAASGGSVMLAASTMSVRANARAFAPRPHARSSRGSARVPRGMGSLRRSSSTVGQRRDAAVTRAVSSDHSRADRRGTKLSMRASSDDGYALDNTQVRRVTRRPPTRHRGRAIR